VSIEYGRGRRRRSRGKVVHDGGSVDTVAVVVPEVK